MKAILNSIGQSLQKWKSPLLMLGMVSTALPLGMNVHASEDGFVVKQVQTKLIDDVYHVSVDVEYGFSQDVLAAIESGVPLIIVLDIELVEPRSYIWNKEVANLEQRFQLHYHALAEQYVVRNLNSGAQFTAPTLHSALYYLREINDIPLIDKQLLEPDHNYQVRLRVSLEFDTLPVPLKLSAYTSRSWWLGSDWFSLDL